VKPSASPAANRSCESPANNRGTPNNAPRSDDSGATGRPGDQPVDELVDVAGLGQTPLGQLVDQLGLGQSLVPLARLLTLLPGRGPLGPLGLAFLLPGGFFRVLGLLSESWKRTVKVFTDQAGPVAQLPRIDLTEPVSRYFEFLQQVFDANRELATGWAQLVTSLSASVRDQAQKVSGAVSDEVDAVGDLAVRPARQAEELVFFRPRSAISPSISEAACRRGSCREKRAAMPSLTSPKPVHHRSGSTLCAAATAASSVFDTNIG
jgi:hypothetical protein